MKKLNPVGPYPSPFLHKFVPFVYICSGLCWNIVINQEDGIEEKKKFYFFFLMCFFVAHGELRGKGVWESLV